MCCLRRPPHLQTRMGSHHSTGRPRRARAAGSRRLCFGSSRTTRLRACRARSRERDARGIPCARRSGCGTSLRLAVPSRPRGAGHDAAPRRATLRAKRTTRGARTGTPGGSTTGFTASSPTRSPRDSTRSSRASRRPRVASPASNGGSSAYARPPRSRAREGTRVTPRSRRERRTRARGRVRLAPRARPLGFLKRRRARRARVIFLSSRSSPRRPRRAVSRVPSVRLRRTSTFERTERAGRDCCTRRRRSRLKRRFRATRTSAAFTRARAPTGRLREASSRDRCRPSKGSTTGPTTGPTTRVYRGSSRACARCAPRRRA